MENKERKIVKSITALQKSLFEYKNFIKQLPFEINKNTANKLVLEASKNMIVTYQHIIEQFKLISKLNPESNTEKEIEKINLMHEAIGSMKTACEILEQEIKKDVE